MSEHDDFEFDRETRIVALDHNRWTTQISSAWNIGDNPNGGYLIASALQAAAEVSGQSDPLTVTTHYLRPGLGGRAGELAVDVVRRGRRFTNVGAQLTQDDKVRYQLIAAMGDLEAAEPTHEDLTIDPPRLPPPDECLSRVSLEQGVDLPIMSRLDVRIDPQQAEAGQSDRAETAGWIRFADRRPIDAASLVLFCDAFPPSLFSLLGMVGWVPTIELTVQVRRRPAHGWIQARFATRDLADGLLIEDGELWDETGALVARSRQLALLL